MKKAINSRLILLPLLAIVLLGTSCTKADYSDDFPKGDAPPVAGGYTNSRQIAPTNLVGYWSFNGSLADSVSGTNGTASGTSFSTGLKGQALQGGTNAYALATPSNAIRSMTAYTISVWVNTSQNTGATGIVSLGDTRNFWGNINVFFENGGTATKAVFKTIFQDNANVYDNGIQEVEGGFNTWVQYTITYDGAGSFKSYVNGSLAATKTVAGGGAIRFTNVGPIVFGTLHFMTNPSSTSGSTSQTWAGYLPGKIDEVRFYNKALSETEVTALSVLEKQGR
jgi:hypothetical protein